MKFEATVIFEFQASSLGDAGQKLNHVLGLAGQSGVEAKGVELRTPLPSRQPVTLPAMGAEQRPGAPRAIGATG